MDSLALGNNISSVEVTHISSDGDLLSRVEKLLMSYEDFPWFKNQPVNAILCVKGPSPNHCESI